MSKYANFCTNLAVLKRADSQDLDNEFIQSGVIDKYAMQFELMWKLLRKALAYEGVSEAKTGSPRSAIKAAYSVYDFIDEQLYLTMLESRNAAEHVYDADMAKRLVATILAEYIPAFVQLQEHLENYYPLELLQTW